MTPSPKPKSPKYQHPVRNRLGSKTNKKQGNIRIISGKHRGRKLPVLLADGLRPTADRVKETLFNWLMQDIAGARVLDMFAGAGSLGFEAVSRNAAYVLMLENNHKSAAQLQQNIDLLGAGDCAQVQHGDAFEALNTSIEAFDIVFIDPPFHHDMVGKAIQTLLLHEALNPEALVYIESEASFNEVLPKHLIKIKENATQQVNYQLYRFSSPST